MPLYEYECPEDGERITLLRPMDDADAPVADPSGRGRRFVRAMSSFAVRGTGEGSSGQVSLTPRHGGCACGKPHGSCHS